MKTLTAIVALCGASLFAAPAFAASHAGADAKTKCEKSADDKKLAGAARTSHVKKCVADAHGPMAAGGSAECEKSADEKKLAGAARTSHIKKCTADMGAAKK